MKKTFLWFRLGVLLSFCLVGLFSPAIVSADHCVVAGIKIIPGSWPSSETKIALTVQAQDDGGNPCHASATMRLSFESSNSSGTFSNQAGSAAPQAWISTNQYNRHFYYESDNLNEDSITISAGYGSASDWSSSWVTTENISHLLALSTDEDDNEADKDDDNDIDDSSSGGTSVHTESVPLSVKKSPVKLEVDAGRKRLAIVGQEIKFLAEQVAGENSRSINYDWSFGDGSAGKGQSTFHVYRYPGIYNVVLNASTGESRAVARTKATIIEAELGVEVVDVDQNIVSITNNSSAEVNIGGFILTAGQQDFTLADDTILDPKAKLVLDKKMTGFNLVEVEKVTLRTADVILAETQLVQGSLMLTEEQVLALQEIEQEVFRLAMIVNSRALASGRVNNYRPNKITLDGAVNPEVKDEKNSSIKYNQQEEPVVKDSQTENVIILKKPDGWWKKALSLPNRGLALINNIF